MLADEWANLEECRDAFSPEVEAIVSKGFFGRAGKGEITNYTVVYYPPREFLGQEPYVVGHMSSSSGIGRPSV